MDSQNQLLYFSLCICIGFCGGMIYEFFAFSQILFRSWKHKFFGAVVDITFFLVFAVVCIKLSYGLNFPTLRGYMWIGYAVGGVLYLKTLRRMVAFLEKVCYNKLAKVLKRQKSKKKLLQ